MSFGTRFRRTTETTPSLKTTVGAALVGAALLGGSLGLAGAQDASPEASPEASPMASPVAMIDWIDQVTMETETEIEGDRASVGVVLGEEPVINVAEIEIRPYIILQTDNQTEMAQNVAVFAVGEEFDVTTFTFPGSEADLPEGVTPVGAYQVAPGEQYAAVFTDLTEGSYVVATDGGMTIPFAVIPLVDLEVPDLFATPDSTPES
ncbi:MAG: hypothetical protein H0V37_08630 [Chloroflexia bacterium]|nr:hypothetical protein [Chloroflexia bacterium]